MNDQSHEPNYHHKIFMRGAATKVALRTILTHVSTRVCAASLPNPIELAKAH